MDYAKVLKLPQYFRNLQRLGEIVGVLGKHGFGDLVQRLNLLSYLQTGMRVFRPSVLPDKRAALSFPTRIRLVCEELGPTFIKLGQLVATRPDIFPPHITHELRQLQDKVKPFPVEHAKELITKELGRPLSDIYATFEDVPLAAASIAQVHRATLKDGSQVVVKVQRPNLDRIIETDIDILRGLAALVEEHIPESLSFAPSKLIEDFARSLVLECDFLREAMHIDRFAGCFADQPNLIVPRVYNHFSSRRVLTEQYIHGLKADETEKITSLGIDCTAVVQTLNDVILRSIFEHRYFHADPHPGNILITHKGQVALIDFGSMGRLDKRRSMHILQFVMATLARDTDGMLRILHETQIAPPHLDELSLKTQVAEILDIYLDKPLGELNIAALLVDVFEVLRRYGILFPPDLLLVAKALTTLEHVGARLDPDFEPIQSIRPYLLQRYAREIANPKTHAHYLTTLLDSYRRLATDLPIELRALLRLLARQEYVLTTRNQDFDELRRHQNQMLNRALIVAFGLGMVAVGIYLASREAVIIDKYAAYVFLGLGIFALFGAWRSIRRTGGSA